MEPREGTQSARKHEAILQAASELFIRKGYQDTSMEEIAELAAVGKQTVYKHFSGKEQLFADVVLATTDQVTGVTRMVSAALGDTSDLAHSLRELARSLLTTLMEPGLLRLRRLVIATTDQFPGIGATWYEQGFGRVLRALADSFEGLTGRGLLRADDPLLAAHHFVGLLLWIPVNRAMFTGDYSSNKADLESYADAAVRAFLAAYAP